MKPAIAAATFLLLQLTAFSLQVPTETSISGRVTGPTGQPLVGMEVWLFRPELDLDARKILWKPAGTATTNDRGEYRHFGVVPGRYYLASGSVTPAMSPQTSAGLLGRRPDERPASTETRRYATVFYPNTSDSLQATALDIGARRERTGIDFSLKELRTFTIRARYVVDEAIPPNARVTVTSGLYFREPGVSQGAIGSGPRIPLNAENRFEFADVPPGRYWVTVTLGIVDGTPPRAPVVGPRPSPPTPEEDLARLKEYEAYLASPAIRFIRGIAPVDVVDSDLDGVTVHGKPATAIQGSITFEGETSVVARDRIRVSINPPMYGIQPEGGAIPAPPMAVRTDGSFGFPMFLPSDAYRLSVTDLQDDVYVKAVRFGARDILGESFTLPAAASDRFEILLNAKGGRIEGSSSPGAAVVLVPQAKLERPDLFRTATADTAGRFTLRGLAPGVYILFAFEKSTDSYLALEHAGTAVQVTESSRETVNLPIGR